MWLDNSCSDRGRSSNSKMLASKLHERDSRSRAFSERPRFSAKLRLVVWQQDLHRLYKALFDFCSGRWIISNAGNHLSNTDRICKRTAWHNEVAEWEVCLTVVHRKNSALIAMSATNQEFEITYGGTHAQFGEMTSRSRRKQLP